MSTDSPIIKALSWRNATKKFNTAKKVSDADFAEIIESARLSPSSFGLQPWKFVIVKDPKIRAQVRAAAYDQAQVTDASHFIVMAVNKNVDEAYIDHYIAAIVKERGIPKESLKGFEDSMKGSLKRRSAAEGVNWSSRQVYIALGIILETAALKGIDACPMEGFDNAKVDSILGLDKLGFGSLAFAAIGYRASDDPMSTMKKVRFPKEEVVMEI